MPAGNESAVIQKTGGNKTVGDWLFVSVEILEV